MDLEGAVVPVLGWAGASARQLRVVLGWYRERGARPFAVLPRVLRNMSWPRGWAMEGEALARRLRAESRATDAAIVVHLFSNAGFWTHAATLNALRGHRSPGSDRVLERVAGVAIDSAPGFGERIEAPFFARYSAMAVMPMLLGALGRPPALHHRWLSPAARAFMRAWYHLSPQQRRTAEGSLEIVRSTGTWPHLLSYSEADPLIPVDLVERFIASLQRRGRAVERLRWEGSGHVAHMVRHRHDYFEALQRWIAALPPPSGA